MKGCPCFSSSSLRMRPSSSPTEPPSWCTARSRSTAHRTKCAPTSKPPTSVALRNPTTRRKDEQGKPDDQRRGGDCRRRRARCGLFERGKHDLIEVRRQISGRHEQLDHC